MLTTTKQQPSKVESSTAAQPRARPLASSACPPTDDAAAVFLVVTGSGARHASLETQERPARTTIEAGCRVGTGCSVATAYNNAAIGMHCRAHAADVLFVRPLT